MSRTLRARFRLSRGTFRLDVSLDAAPGLTVLFGPSGAGKSTLLDCLAGLLRPETAEIVLSDRLLQRQGSVFVPPERRRIGYVPQDLLLFPHLTVEQNIEFGYPTSPSREQQHRREVLQRKLGLVPLLGRRPRELSGGEAQRCALARALLSFPDLLLLDEPLSSLDRETKERALAELLSLKHEMDLPILYVTHSASEVLALADRVILLREGRILREGGPELAFDVAAGSTDTRDALNFLSCVVEEGGAAQGGTRVRWGDQTLKVGGIGLPPGSPLVLAVSPHDILVSLCSPGLTSARNLIRGRVTGITESDTHVLLRVGEREALFVSVTPEAKHELDLRGGMDVYLLIKSTALRRVSEVPPGFGGQGGFPAGRGTG